MTVYGITVVKDEADIIETSLRHMAAEVDRMIVGDHLSTDGTRDILDRLAQELPLTVVDETDPGHIQDERMTRYARMALDQGATWVVPFDADEIWYSDHGRVADVLAQCPEQMGVLAATGYDHLVRTDTDGPFSPWRRPEVQPFPKVCFRAHPDVSVAMGNHSVAHPLQTGAGPVQYRHFQYRSLEHAARKAVEGTKATDAAGHDEQTDFHWRELAAMDDDELAARWAVTCDTAGLVYDPAPIRAPVSVSIIVPTLDRSDLLGRCVASIVATTVAELIVQRDDNRDGFAHTCNLGAKDASGDVLIFLNDDTVVSPGWVEALTRRIDWGIVGGLLAYPDGTVQHSGVFLRRNGPLEAVNRKTAVDGPSEVPAVTGACLAVSRGLWDELGGFDEGYRNGYEDVDLCLRARRHGARVFLASDCQVVHLESQSDRTQRFGHAPQNIALLNERWADLLKEDL